MYSKSIDFIQTIDQKFFMNPDEIKNWYGAEGCLYKLLFIDCNVIDDKGNEYVLPELEEFYSVDEWKKFKVALIQKIEQLKKYTKIWVENLEGVQSQIVDEDEAKQYWDDLDDDDYYKEKYKKFEKWYQSDSYYQWEADNRNSDLEYINNDFPEFNKVIDSKIYYNDSYSGSYYWDDIENQLDNMKDYSLEIITDIDKGIEEAIEEHKYDAIVYAFR